MFRMHLKSAWCQALVITAALATALQAADAGPMDGHRAFSYLQAICALGPRISGTPAMTRQQELIEKHFHDLGADIRFQDFEVPHPQTGEPVRMRNLIVVWNPQVPQRSLVCCHYDTRPHPDQEQNPANRQKPFLGANDGASGVAVLMELGHHLAALSPRPAVDFVFFDGEELVYDQDDKYFYGSEYFSQAYRDAKNRPFTYGQGVLLDMVGGKNASFYMEGNSLRYAPQVTQQVWKTARRIGQKNFIERRKHEVLDDHLALNQIAGIPTCDIIDFDYPYWHRRNDLPAACSDQTLAGVGHVVLEWLRGD